MSLYIRRIFEPRNIVPFSMSILVGFTGYASLHLGVSEFLLAAILAVVAGAFLRLKLTQAERIERKTNSLYQLAYRDELTGLANRRKFTEVLKERLNLRVPGSVLLIDLDNFKSVNDNYGHETGDQVLRIASDRIRQYLPDNALLARLGGDEFVALIHSEDESIALLMLRIKQELAKPIFLSGIQANIGASIGSCSIKNKSQHVSDILSCADRSMYLDKRNGATQPETRRGSFDEMLTMSWMMRPLQSIGEMKLRAG